MVVVVFGGGCHIDKEMRHTPVSACLMGEVKELQHRGYLVLG